MYREGVASHTMVLLQLPQDVIESIVFLALLGDPVLSSEAGVRRVLCSIRASCQFLRHASGMHSVARKCLSSPGILEDLLLARRRVALHRFLRLVGGYALAVETFSHEISRLRESKFASIPLPIVATLCKLLGRLFAQISAYTQAEKLLLDALAIDTAQQGAKAEEVAATLHNLSEMLRGSVSACPVARERRQSALRGIKYARECFAIRKAAAGEAEEKRKTRYNDVFESPAKSATSRRVACANALHLLGYHCAEFASGKHARCYFEQATTALSRAQHIFREVSDDEMTATSLQDLGLCCYYQRRYKEAMSLYTSACHVIIEKLGHSHPDLAVPTFNIANIMCAAGQYRRAIDFYRIAYSINVASLGQGHAWTETTLSSLKEAIECDIKTDRDDPPNTQELITPLSPQAAHYEIVDADAADAVMQEEGEHVHQQGTNHDLGAHAAASPHAASAGVVVGGGSAGAGGHANRDDDGDMSHAAHVNAAHMNDAHLKAVHTTQSHGEQSHEALTNAAPTNHTSPHQWSPTHSLTPPTPAPTPPEPHSPVSAGGGGLSAHGGGGVVCGEEADSGGDSRGGTEARGDGSSKVYKALLLWDEAIEALLQKSLVDVEVDIDDEDGVIYSDSDDDSNADDYAEACLELSLIKDQLQEGAEVAVRV